MATNGHFSTMAIFFLADTVHTLNLVSNSLQRPPLYNCHLSWRTVHTFTLVLTSLLWPPLYNGHFLLSPRWPLYTREVQLYLETILSCRKVMTVLAVFFFTTRNCRTSAKEKEKKKRESRTRHRSGWAYCDATFHLSPYIITECEFLCYVKIEGQFV